MARIWNASMERATYTITAQDIKEARDYKGLAVVLVKAMEDLLQAYNGDAGGDWDDNGRHTMETFGGIIDAAKHILAKGG